MLRRKSSAPRLALKYSLAYVPEMGLVEYIKIQVITIIKKLPLINAYRSRKRENRPNEIENVQYASGI
jgi:hypothetical protein